MALKGISAVVLAVALATAAPSLTAPSGTAPSAKANPPAIPTVFLGDAFVGGYGIAPVDETRLPCVRAQENLPDVIEDQLADQAILLNITADVACAGARLNHVWEEQDLGGGMTAQPQKKVLAKSTELVVAGLGANTVGLGRILKQCSARLRGAEGALLPDKAVSSRSRAADCTAYFTRGAGKAWLAARFEETGKDLDKLFSEIGSESPSAKVVLVGYPRLVPKDTKLCRAKLPDGGKPLADVPEAALSFLDTKVQGPLNTLMRQKAKQHHAHFVDLYAVSGASTACDGADRAVGGLLEPSMVTLLHQKVPWFLQANETGRDSYGDTVAQSIARMYGRGPA
ncbi:SGNH/GDSL hydrolase family protein [Streptomyces purpureus]|uniref:SGNH/GDSL hydrolase family protein n=1 Tax=Streptomyces purpureus TaxID=1951 RepID=UPI00035C6B05|nr:SGNH/GDSL hydrolase family protein [Streptomyces purpureus]